MVSKNAQAACLTVGLCTAWFGAPPAAQAETITFTGEITPTVSLSSTYLIYGLNTTSFVGAVPIGSFAANTPGGFSVTDEQQFITAEQYQTSGVFLIAGVYDGEEKTTVAVTFPAKGDQPTGDWSTVFGSDFEADIQTALVNGDTNTLFFFLYQAGNATPGAPTSFGGPTTLYAFSDATLAGAATVVATPEPITAGIVVLPMMLLARRRR